RLGVKLPPDLEHIRMGEQLRVDAFEVFSRLSFDAEQQPTACSPKMVEIWRFERVHYCDGLKQGACRESKKLPKDAGVRWEVICGKLITKHPENCFSRS